MKIFAIIASVIAFVGILVWLALNLDVDKGREKTGFKHLSGTIAENFVYEAKNEKFPRASCSACRTGKIKMGHFSLGGLNSIEFDDLVVNLPKKVPNTLSKTNTQQSSSGQEVMNSFGFADLAKSLGKNGVRFSGIKVNRFELNCMDGDKLNHILKAELLKNEGKRIILANVVLYDKDEVVEINKATLELKPIPRIVWPQGSYNLPVNL